MSFAEDMPESEVSQRTALAVEATIEAHKAQSGVTLLKRQLARVNWVWGVLAFFVAVGAVGYGLRDQIGHLATKEKVEADHEELERVKEEQKEMNAVLRGVVDTQKRTLDGVDRANQRLDQLIDRRGR